MTRDDIIQTFRDENPRFKTAKAVSNTTLASWCKIGDKDVCARVRCIPGDFEFTTVEDQAKYDLTDEESKFYAIDEYPGGGIAYDDDRLTKRTIAYLDNNSSGWRTEDSDTPTDFYIRGQYIYLRPAPNDALTVKVYCNLISDDFDSGSKTPYNELTYLEPFHYALVKFLKWKSEQKKGGKRQDALIAKAEYEDYIKFMQRELGGMKYGPIRFVKGD